MWAQTEAGRPFADKHAFGVKPAWGHSRLIGGSITSQNQNIRAQILQRQVKISTFKVLKSYTGTQIYTWHQGGHLYRVGKANIWTKCWDRVASVGTREQSKVLHWTHVEVTRRLEAGISDHNSRPEIPISNSQVRSPPYSWLKQSKNWQFKFRNFSLKSNNIVT